METVNEIPEAILSAWRAFRDATKSSGWRCNASISRDDRPVIGVGDSFHDSTLPGRSGPFRIASVDGLLVHGSPPADVAARILAERAEASK